MARSRPPPRPSFIWQPLLILFPVGVLAAVGLFSLRQDKIIAQHEAIERAQVTADVLLPRLWSALTNANSPEDFEQHAFQIGRTGELLFPPPFKATPSPDPLNPGELNPEQDALWQRAQSAEMNNDIPSAIQVIRDFLATTPPERFAVVASYNLASFLSKQGQFKDAADTCLELLDQNANEISESGLRLDRLAEFKLLEISAMMTNPRPAKVLISPDYFCRAIIFDPSPLTSSFLSWISAHSEALGLKDGNDYWNKVWQQHEEIRQLYRNAHSKLAGNAATGSAYQTSADSAMFWFDNAGGDCLAVRFDQPPESTREASDNAFISGRTHWKGPKGKMDLRPESGKNRMTSPNLIHNQEIDQNTSNTVTLDNEPARVDPSRSAKAIFNRSHGTAERNGMSLPDVSGPATTNLNSAATNPWFLCRTESEISRALFSVLRTQGQVPDYFEFAIDIAGKRLREAAPDLRMWRTVGFFEGGGRGRKIYLRTIATNILASASYPGNGSEQSKVHVFLTSPATLFQRQSDRTFWFGALVAVSAFAAVIGLFSAWRAFNRQQELAELKSNFVSSVSHELRAPIASVRLMAESLERGKVAEPPKQHEYFRFIGQECRRLSSLIENVLDFSRIEQGRKQYEFEPTDLFALVQQTVKLMEPYASERQITLRLEMPNLQPSTCNLELSIDGRAIQQALINLLDNAIKHSPNGQTVTVILETKMNSESAPSSHEPQVTHHKSNHPASSIPHPASSIRLSVIDHGPGVPPEEHEKIFERFYRLGSELRRETQGVGIGLSIVKHIVEAHGGRVVVESAPGKGSRFAIELPGADSHNSAEIHSV